MAETAETKGHAQDWRARELISVPTVAKIVGVSRAGAYQLLRDGKIPGMRRAGKAMRVCVAEFARWVDTGAA